MSRVGGGKGVVEVGGRQPEARGLTRRDFLTVGVGAGLGVFLGGCGGGDASGGVAFLVCGGDSPQATEYWNGAIKTFQKRNGQIQIDKSTVGWNSAHDEIFNRIRAGDAPDLIHTGSRWINEFASLENGLTSLEDYLTPEIRKRYYPSVLGTAESNGEVYGLPNSYSTKALIYRTDLIDKPPETWDELVSTALDVQNENEGVFGIGISADAHVSTADQFSQFLYQAGGRVFDEGGRVAFDDDAGVEALTYYADFYLKHKVTPNPLDSNREELPTLFKNKKIAMMLIGPWGGEPSMGVPPDNEEVPYASALLPAGAERATELVTDSMVMSGDAGNPDAAWRFMEFTANPEQQAKKDVVMGGVPLMPRETKIDPDFVEDPYFKTFIDMSEYGVPAPTPAVWTPFENIMVDMVQSVMLEKATPKQAIDTAAKAIKGEKLEPAGRG